MKKNGFSCFVVIAITVVLPGAPRALAKQSCQAIGCHEIARQAATATTPLSGLRTADERDGTAPDARYRLRTGDVVELSFPFVPTFNHTITIQPDGYVTLHALGARRVDGLTVPELTETLRAEYASILRDPVITVTLKEFEKPYFIVAGEVERPGKYDLRGDTTVTQAVAIAGGLKDRAKQSKAAVFHRLPGGGFETKTFDLKKVLNEAQLVADLRLEPGDMLFIPRGRRLPNISELASSLWILSWF
jgi:protein involved in polysaccharide export with SLBB domain